MSRFTVKTAQKKYQNILVEVLVTIVHIACIQSISTKSFLVIEPVNVTDS